MKFINFHKKPISLFMTVTFTFLLCFWANQTPAVPVTSVSEKNSSASLEKNESESPGYFEQEQPEPAVKKAKKVPLLLVAAGAIVLGAVVYFVILKKSKLELTVNLEAGVQGTPGGGTYKYKKGESVGYSYSLLSNNYSGLKVLLDGNEVSASGSFVMDRSHRLSVSANKIEAAFFNGVLTVNNVRYEMASIPAGTFLMGNSSKVHWSSDEIPAHSVRISKGFWIGKTEVSQELWRAVMGNNPSFFKNNTNLPVEQVSWNDCQLFIQTLNNALGNSFRLPTEAEWEYACRASATGDSYGELNAIAWYLENSGGSTHPVGQKQPNAFGLYDVLGNVGEWCQDWYSNSYYKSSPSVDPLGPASGNGKVWRGMPWNVEAKYMYIAYRNLYSPRNGENFIGIRLVKTK